jgi:hypothetical protein
MFDARMLAFPPRLPDQPIFYPVLERGYAIQIARDWNAPSEQSRFAGFVTEFEIAGDYLTQFPEKTVGSSLHRELWVPSDRLAEFNTQIRGPIRITNAFFSVSYIGFVPDRFGLAGKTAAEQLKCMAATLGYSGMDFVLETAANNKAIYLNFPFWVSGSFSEHVLPDGKRQQTIAALREVWDQRFSEIPLYVPPP